MTKDEFHRIAAELLEDMLGLPDELWAQTQPEMTAQLGDEVVFVGIRPAREEDDREL